MTFTQLRAFVAVATTGSIRQAAERPVVSQPAVSAAVSALQREIGIALVARHGRGLRLTPADLVFARYSRQVLGLVEEGKAAAAGQLHPERGRFGWWRSPPPASTSYRRTWRRSARSAQRPRSSSRW